MIVEATEQEAERLLRRLGTPSVAARARADVKEFVESGARVCRVELSGADRARLGSLCATYRKAALGAGVEVRRDDGRLFLVRRADRGAR